MAESMSEQIFSIACALSKADESEKSMLRMICTAQEETEHGTVYDGVARIGRSMLETTSVTSLH